jgi:hypothetical protein
MQTAINLGNEWNKQALTQNKCVPILICFVCSGTTAWLLTIVRGSWNWVQIFAGTGLHISLMEMSMIPLWHSWHTERVVEYINPEKLRLLCEGHAKKDSIKILHVRVAGGDVLHFQGDTSFPRGFTSLLKGVACLLCVTSAAAYLAQFAVV